MTNIFNLLDKGEEYRTIDLGENYIYFQYVDDSSFIYTTVKNQEVMALIMPLIERISNTIANLFPSPNWELKVYDISSFNKFKISFVFLFTFLGTLRLIT